MYYMKEYDTSDMVGKKHTCTFFKTLINYLILLFHCCINAIVTTGEYY